MANRNLDKVLASDYLDGIENWPIETLRDKRNECQLLEDAASYLRRLLQTRIDILGSELRARAGGANADAESMVDRLKSSLVDERSTHGPTGRLLSSGPREDQETWAHRRVLEAARGADVEAAPDLSDADLTDLAGRFIDLERVVSSERRALHDVYDRLQAELIERYRSGRATVDGLLR